MLDDIKAVLPTKPYPDVPNLLKDIERALRQKYPAAWNPDERDFPALIVYPDPGDRTKALAEFRPEDRGTSYLILIDGSQVVSVMPKDESKAYWVGEEQPSI